MEALEDTLYPIGCFCSPQWESHNLRETVESGEEEEEEKGEGFFHEEDRREIVGRRLCRDEFSRSILKEWVVKEEDIATGDPGEDDHDTERVVSKRLEDRNLFHVRDDIPREHFRRTIIIEFLFGERIHLLARHIPDIREIDHIDRDETNDENGDEFSYKGIGESQALSP